MTGFSFAGLNLTAYAAKQMVFAQRRQMRIQERRALHFQPAPVPAPGPVVERRRQVLGKTIGKRA